MKLLICTQVVDKNHSVLGFFHRWVEEFAKHNEHVHVICLYEGEHQLSENVTVHSLGKEGGVSRLKYLYRFYKYIWQLRHEYDAVFVHMNQIYVILGAPFWRATGKRICLWYMHKSTGFTLWLAEKLTHKIFTASKESFRLPSNKLFITGHGIDTELFKPADDVKKDIDIITVGRISPSKNLELMIEALALIRKSKPVTLTIVGGVSGPGSEAYKAMLDALIKEKQLADVVEFFGSVEHGALPALLQSAKVFWHTATNGSLDKTLLEALACKVPVVSTSEAVQALPLGDWAVTNPEEIAKVTLQILNSVDSIQINELCAFVQLEHSIINLHQKLAKQIN